MIYEFYQRETDYCVAVFNSRVSKHFEWYRTLKDRRVTTLHLVDDRFTWYHRCIDETQWLLKKYKPERLVGASMGAYAALLFGSLLKIPVKAFGPQTTLLAEWDPRWTPEWVNIRRDTKYPQYLDLAGMKVKADIYYCNAVLLDKWHAKRMKGCVMKPRGCNKHSDEVNNISANEIFESSIGVEKHGSEISSEGLRSADEPDE